MTAHQHKKGRIIGPWKKKITTAQQPELKVNSYEGGFTEIETSEFMGVLTISNELIPELIERLQVISRPPTSAPEQCPAQNVLDFAIKDLEREIKDQQWMIENYNGHHKEIHESIQKALQYALNLIRGEHP